MNQHLLPTRTLSLLRLGLFCCGLLPLGLLAALTVRSTAHMLVLAVAIGLLFVISIWCSRYMAGRLATTASENGILEAQAGGAGQTSLDEQMVQMEKMANMGRLAADITHELNNPLQLILSQASWIEELLGDEEPGQVKNLDEYRKTTAGIKQQVARATRITGRVLGYSRQTDDEETSVQINALVEETWSFLEKKARSSNISHSLQLDQSLPPTLTRGHQLQQVLLNLMDNALDAMSAVGQDGAIRIRTSHADGTILIEVDDTGPGIPEAVLERIWQPFFTTKERGKGTGLGLAISRQTVRSLGGELRAHNKAGETGAVFTVKIPINQGATTSTMQG